MNLTRQLKPKLFELGFEGGELFKAIKLKPFELGFEAKVIEKTDLKIDLS
ncbi:454_t:CDS:2 [Cetraspora pellucida]|uniref:454_t:CDS:1 n=1 Tax=Cetraspora pellucida TaxID=1433469 RepID=A0A9N9BXN3_9GLOM|nr:454_t:CDS:2 [Cetraspora pellucida]